MIQMSATHFRLILRILVTSVLVFLILSSGVLAQKRCKNAALTKPDKLEKDTETYYLKWVAYGEVGQRAVASLSLLDLENKTQYDLTRTLWKCESFPLVKNALLLSLFDQQPQRHLKNVRDLLPDPRDDHFLKIFIGGDTVKLKSLETGTPKQFDDYIKKGYIDYYFDWGRTAALRLAKHGYLSDDVFESVLSLASSTTLYSSRKEAEEVFDLFEGIPPYDPSPKGHLDDLPGALPERIPESLVPYERSRLEQVKVIRKWYEQNKKKLKWDTATGKYIIEG